MPFQTLRALVVARIVGTEKRTTQAGSEPAPRPSTIASVPSRVVNYQILVIAVSSLFSLVSITPCRDGQLNHEATLLPERRSANSRFRGKNTWPLYEVILKFCLDVYML